MLETERIDSRTSLCQGYAGQEGAKIAKKKSFDKGKFAPEIPKSSVP